MSIRPALRSCSVSLWAFTITLALGSAAAAFTEAGDAPSLPPGQDATGSSPLTIYGTFAAIDDVDLYRIEITDAASFAAETTANPGVDTVLFLFDANGFAIAGNDDITGGTAADQYFSRLAGIAGLVDGTYLLSISRWPYFPVSAAGQMYSVDLGNEVLVPDQGVAYPTGPAGSQILLGWQNPFGVDDSLEPPYSIRVTGVPEPACDAAGAAALGAFASIGLARRKV